MTASRRHEAITLAGLGALVAVLGLSTARPATAAAAPDAKVAGAIRQTLIDLPLGFEPNVGQTDSSVRFLARSGGLTLYLAPGSSLLALAGSGASAAVRMDLVGGDPQAPMEGMDELSGKANYLRGSDPRHWHANVATFRAVRVRDAWPGIDLVHHGSGGSLEHDFVVAPGADPGRIRLAYSGADAICIQADGSLVLTTAAGDLVERTPVVYQQDGHERRSVAGRFVLLSDREVGFEVGAYASDRVLVIDPVLVYSTYLGGSGVENLGEAIAADASGNVYVTSRTGSVDFPVTTGAYDLSHNGATDVFVAKLSELGDGLVYSTFIGGSATDASYGIAVDGAGNAFLSGLTTSADFPVTAGAFQTSLRGTIDPFVLKLDPTGAALVYSTYLGGSVSVGPTEWDLASAIAIDSTGNAYVAGQTAATDFPTTPGAYDRSFNGSSDSDGFVSKLNPAGSALVYSTYLGGVPWDTATGEYASGISIDASGNAYVAGATNSKKFPVTLGAHDRSYNGKGDAFVTKLNPAGSALVYSTYLGGSDKDFGSSMGIDGAGNAYVTGQTKSASFPTTTGAFDRTIDPAASAFDGSYLGDAFVTKLNPAGSALAYSTYLGGNGIDWARAVAVDGATGVAFVGGLTRSSDFPTTPDAFDLSANGGEDAFLTKFGAAGALAYSTYLGGALDDKSLDLARSGSRVFVCGDTLSTDLPTASPLQPALAGSFDLFVARFDF